MNSYNNDNDIRLHSTNTNVHKTIMSIRLDFAFILDKNVDITLIIIISGTLHALIHFQNDWKQFSLQK